MSAAAPEGAQKQAEMQNASFEEERVSEEKGEEQMGAEDEDLDVEARSSASSDKN